MAIWATGPQAMTTEVPGTLPLGVLSITEARVQLPGLLARFREAGPAAQPVVLGRRRRAEAVLVHYDRYRLTLDELEAAQAWIADFRRAADLSRIPR